ncbi:hypothetical protein [Leclercia pneumoniae]|uniref:hypothetical protein n=1 Tax=Leclercia pneumoniae TaxID=2815358 RepID=UPI0030D15835
MFAYAVQIAVLELRKVRDAAAALAAENAGLKAVCEDRRTFIMNGVQLGYIQVPTVETDPALETIRVAVSPQEPTPATDSFLAEVRAQGAEECIRQLVISDDDDFSDAPNVCAMVAHQLRKGVQS